MVLEGCQKETLENVPFKTPVCFVTLGSPASRGILADEVSPNYVGAYSLDGPGP